MNRYLIIGLAGLATLAVIAGFAFLTISKLDSMIDNAAATKAQERDAYWTGQIEKSNAQANAKIAESLKETMAAQDAARDQIAAAEQRAPQLEKENAALPDDGTGGLSRERVRLLNQR
ncbi:hypothetical protein [Rhizobium lusitanum]|uniref:Uncharacterized protein n=1 Tax=Rhizobium lusitanum TaxID=293958 RepID=A0A1C3USR8_9HYPH|nr:hypothetical protein [Rhizobium lusitanum]SCB18377.1 hypothetical protein GA0061101_103255 [Rhizobium lusitanum]